MTSCGADTYKCVCVSAGQREYAPKDSKQGNMENLLERITYMWVVLCVCVGEYMCASITCQKRDETFIFFLNHNKTL